MRERETELEQAYTRLQEGEAPTEDAAQHWNRMMRNQALRKHDDEMRRTVSRRKGRGGVEGEMGKCPFSRLLFSLPKALGMIKPSCLCFAWNPKSYIYLVKPDFLIC